MAERPYTDEFYRNAHIASRHSGPLGILMAVSVKLIQLGVPGAESIREAEQTNFAVIDEACNPRKIEGRSREAQERAMDVLAMRLAQLGGQLPPEAADGAFLATRKQVQALVAAGEALKIEDVTARAESLLRPPADTKESEPSSPTDSAPTRAVMDSEKQFFRAAVMGSPFDGDVAVIPTTPGRRKKVMHNNIIFMKYGRHAGQDLLEILKDKKADLERLGYFFWGYGGSACNPESQVLRFVKGAGSEVSLVMSYTSSKPSPSTEPVPQHEYSCDGINWMAIPDGLHITGSKWAVVCDSLIECDFQLHPHEYEVAVGPNEFKRLDGYVKGQTTRLRLALGAGGSFILMKPRSPRTRSVSCAR